MSLTLRRAASARALLLAATGATLIITVLLTGLAAYSRDTVAAGARSALSDAPAQERSVLLRGPVGTSRTYGERDAAVQAAMAAGFGGRAARVNATAAAAGLELSGDLPAGMSGGALASVVFLDGLPDRAELVSGAWPHATTGDGPAQAALVEPVATLLGVAVGDRVPITSRLSRRPADVVVSGIFRPRDPGDPYWLLAPGAQTGVAPQSSTYGPFVVAREDFLRRLTASASASWLIEPELVGASPAALASVGRAATEASESLPKRVGLDSSGVATTDLPALTDRIRRADLVGRSALVTPMLLMAVLGGYALLLIALLLGEHRRGETALLRARGAARGQLAALAAREAALVVLPAAALAPVLATEILRYADRSGRLVQAISLHPRLDTLTWLVAAAAAVGCGLAMLGPALRRGGTYVAELAGRSRPTRRAAAQRAGVDLALVGLAILAWSQLRQYSSPVGGSSGTLRIDPLLAAAPTIGVLAGAVVALRALPPLTRQAERYVDRRPWAGAMLGTWQAGRRPHAGPVLLLALALGVSTLAWCLVATSQRSVVDQADHRVGADLRLVDTSWFPSPDRAQQVAALPGVTAMAAVGREELGLGAAMEPGSLVAIDTRAAADVLRMRGDLADGSATGMLSTLAAQAVDPARIALPAGTRQLTGRMTVVEAQFTDIYNNSAESPVHTAAVFAVPGGQYREVPLGAAVAGRPERFAVDLPAELDGAALAGFRVTTDVSSGSRFAWELDELAADGTPVDLGTAGFWRVFDQVGTEVGGKEGDALVVDFQPEGSIWGRARLDLVASPQASTAAVPIMATPQALAALKIDVGATTRLSFGGGPVEVRVVDTVEAVPGDTRPAALVADLPTLAAAEFQRYGTARRPDEYWLSTGSDGHVAAAAAGKLEGIEVLDRRAAADSAGRDAYATGARTALLVAALGAALLAAVGLAVDLRATSRRRLTELAVLHTLGAGPRLLARSLVVEQAFLAVVGVLVGVAVGIGVAATMAPLVILTPAAAPPVPAPLLVVPWLRVGVTACALLVLALVMSGLVATTMRQRLVAAQLRIGSDS